MTENKLRSIISNVKYKSWTFFVGKGPEGRLFLQCRWEDFDIDDPLSKLEMHGRKWFLSPHMTETELVQTTLKAVLAAEEHEAKERFLYCQTKIFNPHTSVKALMEVCHKIEVRK